MYEIKLSVLKDTLCDTQSSSNEALLPLFNLSCFPHYNSLCMPLAPSSMPLP